MGIRIRALANDRIPGDFGIEYGCNVINDLPAEGLVWFGGNSIGKGNYCAPNKVILLLF